MGKFKRPPSSQRNCLREPQPQGHPATRPPSSWYRELLLAGPKAWELIQVTEQRHRMLNIRCVFKNHCQAEIKDCKKVVGARKMFKGKKQEQQRNSSNLKGSWDETEWGEESKTREDKKVAETGEVGQRRGAQENKKHQQSHSDRNSYQHRQRDRANSDVWHTEGWEHCPRWHCGTRDGDREARPCCLFWSCEEGGASAPRYPALTAQMSS